jgi:hypothetical protein
MIVYLKNPEIDRVQWDNCISASQSSRPYAYSWYLDIMAPGWEALVDDDYDSVFPVPGFRKYGIQYIATPIFLQQLGAFSPDNPADKVINEFIDYMPEFYKFVDLCVGQKVIHPSHKVTERSNYELDLSKPYEELYKNFNRNCKRSITDSLTHKPEIVEDISPGDLISLFQNNKGTEIKLIKQRDYQRLENLMNFCITNKKGKILGVRSRSEKPVFGLFYTNIQGRKTMIFLVNTPESLEKRMGHYVYNELIRESAGSDTIFDFGGSSIPSIASFMESFGSVNNPYYRIYCNRLPWPIRLLK